MHHQLVFNQVTISGKVKEIEVTSDSDWAGCPESRKSTSGYCLHVLGNLIHSSSRTQASIALSSAEAELYAMCSAVAEGLYLRNLMEEAGISEGQAMIRLHTDSSAAKSLLSRSGPGRKSRHIQMRYLYIQDLIQDSQVKISKIPTEGNMADMLTKYLTGDVNAKHAHALGVRQRADEYQLEKH